MFTRRCSERRFFLRPDRETTNAFWYCLGWSAQKHRIIDQGGSMPDAVSLSFQAPPVLARLSRSQYAGMLREHIAAIERDAAAARHISGATLLGPRRVLAQHWDDRPKDAEPRRQISPAVACRDKWRRIERLQQNKPFRLYRAAFDSLRSGLTALFPPGTWCMRFRARIQIGTA